MTFPLQTIRNLWYWYRYLLVRFLFRSCHTWYILVLIYCWRVSSKFDCNFIERKKMRRGAGILTGRHFQRKNYPFVHSRLFVLNYKTRLQQSLTIIFSKYVSLKSRFEFGDVLQINHYFNPAVTWPTHPFPRDTCSVLSNNYTIQLTRVSR